MQTIALADTNRQTTRLGFGCSSIMGALNRRASLRILESAFDAGVRHFDVAPMYGYGEAESCLGEFLQRHRAEVTITTKYGIAPPKKSPIIRLGRHLAGPVLRHLPGAKHRLAQLAKASTPAPPKPTFTPTQAKASLDRSLRALRTDRIDLWLLHEASAADLHDDALLHLLEAEAGKGTIGSFGIGSAAEKVPALLAQHPAYCRTLQYEWSILGPIVPDPIPPSHIFRIHHRALTQNFRALHTTLLQQKALCQRWSQSTHTDLADPANLAHLMLKAALVLNPASIVLFSSKDPTHIQANARIAADHTLDAPARQLHHIIQTESPFVTSVP